jgi:hypothetical protein
MLAYILAVLVGTGSVGLYIAAFFFPEIHRKQDFIWSGVGCFYALTLWIYAHEVSGGILVGQTASVVLIGWFAWQILKLRRQLVPIIGAASQPENQQTPVPATTQTQLQLGLTRSSRPSTTLSTSSVAPSESNSNPVTPTTKTAPQAKPTTPDPTPTAIHTTQTPTVINGEPPRKNRSRSIEVNIPVAQPDPPTVVPAPPVEDDDQAWIKLEFKPSPATSKPAGETAKPAQTPPATAKPSGEIAKPPRSTQHPITPQALPVEKSQPLLEGKAETSAQNNPIDITPIESQLDEEQNWG